MGKLRRVFSVLKLIGKALAAIADAAVSVFAVYTAFTGFRAGATA